MPYMEINIIHYHLFVGGVTSVVRNTLIALRNHHPQLSINILCGSKTNIDQFSQQIADAGFVVETTGLAGAASTHSSSHSVRILIDTDLFYHHDNFTAHHKRQQRILTALEAMRHGVWWIHNYHLGKNCALTAAILEHINNHPAEKFLLHIHDFPEQGRSANYSSLKRSINTSLYPQKSNIHYIVINPGDYAVLHTAGINAKQLQYIPNPTVIETEQALAARYAISAIRRDAVRNTLSQPRIRRYAVGQPIPPQSKILIYPVRTIKRKNILEAMLINVGLNRMHAAQHSSTHPTPYSALIVTLPANSRQHQKYSKMVRRLFATHATTGLWGIGRTLNELQVTYPELISTADAIISTSVQEGFGFTMFEALLARHAFISRTIPTLEMSVPYFSAQQLQQYQSIHCSWELHELKSRKHRLYSFYQAEITRIAPLYPSDAIHTVANQIEELFQQPYIDFSYLSHQLQSAILHSSTAIEQIVASNDELFRGIHHALTHSFPAPDYNALIDAYGSDRFSHNIEIMLAQHNSNTISSTPPVQDSSIDIAIATAHCKINYLRATLNS